MSIFLNPPSNRAVVSREDLDAANARNKTDKVNYNDLGLGTNRLIKEQKRSDKLEVGDFMTLFIEELKNQDPLNPKEGADMVAELAQFSSVEGLSKLNDTVTNFTQRFESQSILQATSLVDRMIDVEGEKFHLQPEESFTGAIEVEQLVPEIELIIEDKFGRVVHSKQIPDPDTGQRFVPKGLLPISWDGIDKNTEERVKNESGPFKIRAEAFVKNEVGKEERSKLTTQISTKVNSVTVDGRELTLNLANDDKVSLGDIKRIQ